jgi:hypothetical protein
MLTAISTALFDLPNEHRTRLEGLWVDDLVYTSAWHKHVSETVEDLKQRVVWVSSITATVVCLLTVKKDFRTSNVSKLSSSFDQANFGILQFQSSYDADFSSPRLDKVIDAALHLGPGHNIRPVARTTKACRHGQCHGGERADT